MSNYKNMFKCVYATNITQIIRKLTTQDVPRRALLYVPGDSERKLTKAFTLNADCIVMDCEDGVATSKKIKARDTIYSILNAEKMPNKKDLAVRLNSVESGLCKGDVRTILSARNKPNTVVLPKVNSTSHLKWFSGILKNYLASKIKINLIILIESANAVLRLSDICKTAEELSLNSNFRPAGLIFGSDDFCATIGVTRTEESLEVLYARQKIVLVAKAFRLQAIDMVHTNYKDMEALRVQCEQGRRLGYTGKQVIHPDQVPVVQELFLPNAQQIQWATELLKAFQQYQSCGQGVFTYKGYMVDIPTIKQAQNIIRTIEIHKENEKKHV